VVSERTKEEPHCQASVADLSPTFILSLQLNTWLRIEEIHASFPFDLMIVFCTFSGIPFVKEKLGVPSINRLPLDMISHRRST